MDDKPQYWSPKAGEKGMTVLHYAAYCQDLAAVRHWVGQGFDVNQMDDGGWTPLVWCIDMAATGEVGSAEAIVDYLVEHGAQLEYKDKRYGSLLEFAHSRDGWVAEHLEKLLMN
jgi:ankyrin repeat protein